MLRRKLAAIAAAGCAAGGVAFAEPTVIFEKGPGTTQGGIYIADTAEFGVFETFCLETGEGTTMDMVFEYTISTDIMFNGNGTINPLDEETAFLYTRFRDGDIPDLLGNPGISDEDLADAMQLAIWFLEESRPTDNPDALTLADLAQDAVDGGSWDGLGFVRVMNVWGRGHVGEQEFAKQDVLVLIPAPPVAGLAALACFGAARRRRS